MKKTVIYLLLLNLVIILIYGCQKMDDTYKKFIIKGGYIYPGKAIDPVVHSGKYRALLSWKKGTDPTIVKAIVYWNNYSDSIAVNNLSTKDSINVYLENLEEQQYTFQIITCNAKGDRSVPSEVLGNVYGDLYLASLLNRPITRASFDDLGKVDIHWGVADITDGAIGVQVRYTDTTGNGRQVYFPVEDESNSITDIKDKTFQFRTVFLPDSLAIDTFYTAFGTFK